MRRLVMLLCALLAGTTVALVPTAAHAVVVHDGGTLTAEVTTTVTVGASDMTTYRLLVPAGAHPTISVTAIDADFTVDAAVTYDNDPTAGSIGDSGRGRVPSDHFIRLKGFPTAVADQPATLTFFCSSCSLSPPPRAVSFILHYPVDIERTVTSSQLLPITTSTPGQRIRLTVEGDYFQFWLFLRNLSLKSAHLGLADAEPFVLLDGFEMLKNGPGQWVAGENSGTRHTIEIVPSVDAIGTLDARVNAASFREQPTEYSAPDSAFLPVTAPADAAVFVNAKSGAPTLIHVQRADLLHSDGTPGSMTVPLLLPGEPARTLGTISSTPVTFSTGSSLEADAGVVIRLVNDGDSSGQVELRVRLDPGPSVPLALDTATTITAPDGATSVRYSLEATPESNYEISFGPATYGGAATTSSPVIIESEFGQPFGSGTLSDSAGASLILATPFSARFDIVLTVPPGGLTVDVLAVKATETAITATMPFESDLTITRGAENITVTLPVTSGRNLVVDVTDVSLSGAPDPTSEADITLLTPTFNGGGLGTLASGGHLFLEAGPMDQDGAATLRIDGRGQATGTVHVVVSEPFDVASGTLAPDTPTRMTVDRRGGLARFRFDAVAGDRFAVSLDAVNLTEIAGVGFGHVDLLRPDGTVFSEATVVNGETAWLEGNDALDATGSWSVVFDPVDERTGSVTATLHRLRLFTSALSLGRDRVLPFSQPGDVQRLTFDGAAGRHVLFHTVAQTVAIRARVISSTGLVIADLSPFQMQEPLVELAVLPAAGTWTLEVDAIGPDTGSVTANVTLVADPVRNVESGQTTRVAYPAAANPTYRFQMRAGQRAAARVNITTPFAQANFYRPDGSLATSLSVVMQEEWIEMDVPADVSGRWTMVLDPFQDLNPGTATTTLWVAADTVVTNRLGQATPVEIKSPAQNVVMPFDVDTANGSSFIHWQIADARTKGTVTLNLVTPFGTVWESVRVAPGTSSGTFFSDLFFDGTWQVVFDGVEDATGKAKVTFTKVPFP